MKASKNYDHMVKGIDMDTYFTKIDKLALAECDFWYLRKKLKFNPPNEKTFEIIIKYYDEITKDDEEKRYEYYYRLVEEYFHNIPRKILVDIAGAYMFDNDYEDIFIYSGLLDSCFEAYKKAVENVKDINLIDNRVLFMMMSPPIELKKLRVFIHHFGKEQLIRRLDSLYQYYDQEFDEELGYERKNIVVKIIRRVKKIKE